MTKKSRKATYIQKWRAKHKLLQVWLSRDDYDKLQKLAASKGKTVKELFLDFVSASLNFINESSKLKQEMKKVRDIAFREGYMKAINDVNKFFEAHGIDIEFYVTSDGKLAIRERPRIRIPIPKKPPVPPWIRQ